MLRGEGIRFLIGWNEITLSNQQVLNEIYNFRAMYKLFNSTQRDLIRHFILEMIYHFYRGILKNYDICLLYIIV